MFTSALDKQYHSDNLYPKQIINIQIHDKNQLDIN